MRSEAPGMLPSDRGCSRPPKRLALCNCRCHDFCGQPLRYGTGMKMLLSRNVWRGRWHMQDLQGEALVTGFGATSLE